MITTIFQFISFSILYSDKKFIQADPQREYHSNVLSGPNLMLVTSGIFFWLGLPLIFLLILIRGHKQNLLTKPRSLSFYKRHFYYFYADYPPGFFYWDFMRMLQKILISLSFILFEDSNNLKACIAFLVITGYSLLCYFKDPYENKNVKNVEIASGLVQLLSIIIFLALFQN